MRQPGRGGPGQNPRPGLVEAPARQVLEVVVTKALGGQVALASPAPLVVGDGVVLVAAGGRPTAAGKRTARLRDGDQVPQGRRRPVGKRLPEVAAIPVSSLLIAMPTSQSMTPGTGWWPGATGFAFSTGLPPGGRPSKCLLDLADQGHMACGEVRAVGVQVAPARGRGP